MDIDEYREGVIQLGEKEAIELAASGRWRTWPAEQRALFQLLQKRLCMPFEVFHSSVEGLLGRPVWTHEFARPELLLAEAYGERERPGFHQILALLHSLGREDAKIIPVMLEEVT